MKLAWAAGLVVVGFVVGEKAAQACAGCSNPNLPGARSSDVGLKPWEVSVALNVSATTMRVVHSDVCPDIGPICAQRNEPPQLHDQRFYVGELRPVIGMGITKTFGVEAQLPLRFLRTTIVYRRLDGTLFTPDYENIHHRNETLVGVADPWLLGRGTWKAGIVGMTARAGLGLPLGSVEQNPFALGRAGKAHEHIQFGTGTFYPVLSFDAGVPIGPVRVNGYAQAIFYLYENTHGYRAGSRYLGGVAGDVEIVKNLRVGVGGDILNEQPERWDGVIEQDGNVGRTDVLAGGSVSYVFGKVTASLGIKVPVWQHFIEASHDHGGDPGQLTYPAIVSLGVQTTFGGERTPPPAPPPPPP